MTAGDGETYVYMELLGSEAGAEWTRVWGSTIGMGTFSLDGLHVFERQDVVAVRLGSSPHNPSFVGWSGVFPLRGCCGCGPRGYQCGGHA